jgi:hypothetical protein
MVDPLVRYARSLERTDVARAAVIYRMAARVDPEGPRAPVIRGAILFLEAERALARGVADPELYRAAVSADPTHQRARAQFEAVAQVEALAARRRRRALGALGLLTVGAAGIVALYNESKKRSRTRSKKKLGPPPVSETTAPVSETSVPPSETTAAGSPTSVQTPSSDVSPSETSVSPSERSISPSETSAAASETSAPASEVVAEESLADRTDPESDTLEEPAPAAKSAAPAREPGLVDVLVTMTGGVAKKRAKRR